MAGLYGTPVQFPEHKEMPVVKLLVALQADDTILVQISEDEKALAFVRLNRDQALDIGKQIIKLAERIPDKPLR